MKAEIDTIVSTGRLASQETKSATEQMTDSLGRFTRLTVRTANLVLERTRSVGRSYTKAMEALARTRETRVQFDRVEKSADETKEESTAQRERCLRLIRDLDGRITTRFDAIETRVDEIKGKVERIKSDEAG